MLERIKLRLPEESNIVLLEELLKSAVDRICLRLGTDQFPVLFETICVEVVVKAYRRIYHEGIQSESIDTINTHFIPGLLDEYNKEFDMFLENKRKEENKTSRRVRFI